MIDTGPPCDAERLAEVGELLGVNLPAPMQRVYAHGDGRYRRDGEWWVIWPLGRLGADNVAGWSGGTLPRSLLAFGDDGTGDPFCVSLQPLHDVVRWSWIDAAVQGNEGTLDEFLEKWVD